MRVGASRVVPRGSEQATHRRPPSASAAYKESARNAPGATVVPSASSTGTPEKESRPKPMTVHRLARTNEARVSGHLGLRRLPAVEKQRVVRAYGDDEQHADEMQNRELAPQSASAAATVSTESTSGARTRAARSSERSANQSSAAMAASPQSDSRIASRRYSA